MGFNSAFKGLKDIVNGVIFKMHHSHG